MFVVLIVLLIGGYFAMIAMPGESYRGPLPPLSDAQAALREELWRDVHRLAGTIGPRCVGTAEAGLDEARAWLVAELREAGYEVRQQAYSVDGHTCVNLDVEIPGKRRPGEIVIIGAHYDSCLDLPAANDNASGVAAVLALARRAAGTTPDRTLRFALFVNEEPPFFQTEAMGSRVYARACRQRGENIVGMVSLETIGYYTDAPDSQQYPPPLGALYPSTGNFIGFIGNEAIRPAGAPGPWRVPAPRAVPLGGGRLAGLLAGGRLVGPLVVLAGGLPGLDGHRHRAIPLPVLPLGPGHTREARLRPHGPRGGWPARVVAELAGGDL